MTPPAEPGTYTFPAPHVFADYRRVTYGIEQEPGGHAIMAQIRCSLSLASTTPATRNPST